MGIKESGERELIKNIFNEIDFAIDSTISDYPVTINNSKFYKIYLKIKEKYTR